MIYQFQCDACGQGFSIDMPPFQPPPAPLCCNYAVRRIYGCYINTSSCKDASHIPESKRVVRSGVVRGKDVNPEREERRFAKHISDRRKELAGQQRGAMRHTHSVPADLYHGKIRETGDKRYWEDPKNVARHKVCKV